MIGILDVGGGMRGIYGAGVFDYCLDRHISFPYCIGVSAGSANAINYIAGQRGRTYKFYTEYAFRKEYMSRELFFRTGSYLDLNYVFGTLTDSDGEYPLDYTAIMGSSKELKVVATDADSGKPVYFTKRNIRQDDYRILCASSCVPVACKPYPFGRHRYYDGGISDPIPLRKALYDGCEKVVVILTRPRDMYRKKAKDKMFAKLIAHKYPRAASRLAHRAETYNAELDYAKSLEREGKVLIIAPDSIGDMKTLTKDRSAIEQLYQKGYRDAEMIPDFIS